MCTSPKSIWQKSAISALSVYFLFGGRLSGGGEQWGGGVFLHFPKVNLSKVCFLERAGSVQQREESPALNQSQSSLSSLHRQDLVTLLDMQVYKR